MNETLLLTTFISAVCSLEDKLSIVYVPHDYRHRQDDRIKSQFYYQNITALYCPRLYNFTYILSPHRMFGAMAAKHIVSAVDVVFTTRMHLAISALERSIPIALIGAHQGKFRFVRDFFNASTNHLLPVHAAAMQDSVAMASFISVQFKNSKRTMQNIKLSIDRVKKDAGAFAYRY